MTDSALHRCGYVALVGAPNAGKSTLMNALIHERLAIVSPKPQTTRRRTLGIVSAAGYQMILLDTPGLLDPAYPLQKALMRVVREVLSDADVVCLLFDVMRAKGAEAVVPDEVRGFDGPRIAVINKVDLLKSKEQMLPLLAQIDGSGLFREIFPISALEGDGVEPLIEAIAGALPIAPPLYPKDQLTEQPERFFAAELVREQVFHCYSEEIPYAVEVEIEEFKERPGAKDYIRALLHVEHDSQKAILIGRGGQAIRALGEAARTEIEALLDRPVFLELRVKVTPKWRRDTSALRRFGYRP